MTLTRSFESVEDDGLLAALVDEASIGASLAPELARPDPTQTPLPPSYGALHRAAAVLAFFDREDLKPAPPEEGDAPDDMNALLGVCKLVSVPGADQGDGTPTRWTLQLAVRRRTLAQMGTPEAIQRALRANPDASGDAQHPTREMLERYLAAPPPALQEQDGRQLTGTRQVVEWLGGLEIIKDLPSAQEVADRSEQATLLQPFETLAGSHFAGRAAELARLREHVGVLPPGSLRERVLRLSERLFELHEKPPLVVWGPGGIGKSSLVARFIWEHATLPSTERFPWAYMDFDRPGLLAEEPLTLLIEGARQLGVQYPVARSACDQMRQRWINELAARPPEVREAMRKRVAPGHAVALAKEASYSNERHRQLLAFRDLLENLKVPDSPFLLVLDTFEQVQYRSPVVVDALLEFLTQFQRHVPRLRVVIAGRAAISTDRPKQTLALEGFDGVAARALLAGLGLPPEVAQQTFNAVGGSPLSLRLAAEAWKAGGDTVTDLRKRSFFGLRIQDSQIQAQLFSRILNHIHDPDVRRLAHPGLVLRRITPEIIADVLAGPCEVKLDGAADAQRLFDEMAREVSLVRLEDGALIYRSDVRRIVMTLLRENDPERVMAIEQAAVAHYEARDAVPRDAATVLLERAEELYHRLQLGQPPEMLNPRWMQGIEPHLAAAVDELPPRERAWLLSRLGRRLMPEELAQASIDVWERDTARSARELLDSGDAVGALRALQQRKERLPGSGLYLLEAEALDRAGHWSTLSTLAAEGMLSADERGRRDVSIGLRLFAARAELSENRLVPAKVLLDEAQALAATNATPVRRIELWLHRLALLRAMDGANDGSAEAADIRSALAGEVQRLSDAKVVRNASLMSWLAVEIGGAELATFARLLRLLGLAFPSSSGLRALAVAIANWHATLAEAEALAQQIGLPPGASLTERWAAWAFKTSPTMVSSSLAELFSRLVPTEGVIAAISDLLLLRARTLLAPGDVLARRAIAASETDVANLRSSSPQPRSTFSWDQPSTDALRQVIAENLSDAFSQSELTEMVLHRLNRQLESITAAAGAPAAMAFRLVSVAEAEGWLQHLVAAALESRPGHAGLTTAARELGLTGAAYELSAGAGAEAESRLLSRQLLLKTLQVIGMVCRLEALQSDGTFHHLGTASLVGPDLLLTARACIDPLIDGELAASSIYARFDEQRRADGEVVLAGTAYPLAPSDGLIATFNSGESPEFKPDCALLRLVRTAGAEPVGGANAEPGAPARRWFSLSSSAGDVSQAASRLALFYEPGGSLRWTTAVETSAAGSPWLDDDARLSALTVLADGGTTPRCMRVPIDEIRLQIEQRGLGGLLDQVLA
jgi:hypothetical protein